MPTRSASAKHWAAEPACRASPSCSRFSCPFWTSKHSRIGPPPRSLGAARPSRRGRRPFGRARSAGRPKRLTPRATTEFSACAERRASSLRRAAQAREHGQEIFRQRLFEIELGFARGMTETELERVQHQAWSADFLVWVVFGVHPFAH